jgi:hypothetical protein
VVIGRFLGCQDGDTRWWLSLVHEGVHRSIVRCQVFEQAVRAIWILSLGVNTVNRGE